MYLRLLVEVAL